MERMRLTKVASVVNKLDKIADEIQNQDEKTALMIDRLSDMVEKKAYYPMGWAPGRGLGPGRGRGYGMGWMPGQQVPSPQYDLGGPGPTGTCVCPSCGYRLEHVRGHACMDINCPKCGQKMDRPINLE